MSDRPLKPYSLLPEPFALVAIAVMIDLLVVYWPDPELFVIRKGLLISSLPVRVLVYGSALAGAAAHSWSIARTAKWWREPKTIGVTALWLFLVAAVVVVLEARSGMPYFGLLVFGQIALCSFIFNHLTLRLTLGVAFVTMLSTSWRLSLFGAGVAWLAFSILSVFLLAYDRTAQKAGPRGYGAGEVRRTTSRAMVCSAVVLIPALLFLITPAIPRFDLRPYLPTFPGAPSSGQESPATAGQPAGHEAQGWGYGLDLKTSTASFATSDKVIMTLTMQPAAQGPLYVRGRVFDTFDGVNWTNTNEDDRSVKAMVGERFNVPNILPGPSMSPEKRAELVEKYITATEIEGVVFTVGNPRRVTLPNSVQNPLYINSLGALKVKSNFPEGSTYYIESNQDIFREEDLARAAPVSGAEWLRYLQVPTSLSPKVLKIAGEQARGRSPYEKAVALEAYLRQNYRYSLKHNITTNVVDQFIERRVGHCALFASTMVMLARKAGLPARYVTGFVATDRDRNTFTIRGKNGHAWVEVYIQGAGWIAFDPTASSAIDPTYARDIAMAGGGVTPPPVQKQNEPGRSIGLNGRKNMGQPGPGHSGTGQPNIASNGGQQPPGNGPNGGVQPPSGSTQPPPTPLPGQQPPQPGQPTPLPELGQQGGGQTAPDGTIIRPPSGDTSLPHTGPVGKSPADANNMAQGFAGSTTPRTPEERAQAERKAEREKAEREKNDPEKQKSDWIWLIMILLGVGLVAIVGAVAWKGGSRKLEKRRIREAVSLEIEDDPDPRRFVVKLYHRMVEGLERIGMLKNIGDTPAEYADKVGQREEKIDAPVHEITDIFHTARYGYPDPTPQDAARARSAWNRVAATVVEDPNFTIQTEEQ